MSDIQVIHPQHTVTEDLQKVTVGHDEALPGLKGPQGGCVRAHRGEDII